MEQKRDKYFGISIIIISSLFLISGLSLLASVLLYGFTTKGLGGALFLLSIVTILLSIFGIFLGRWIIKGILWAKVAGIILLLLVLFFILSVSDVFPF
jgi:hypothetical protein